jgi:hypothetical protein
VTYSEDLHEQMDWIAEDIADWGGDAWVLPVGELPAADEKRIRRLATGRRTATHPAGRPNRSPLTRGAS